MLPPNEPLELRSPWPRICPSALILSLVLLVILTGFRIYGYFGGALFMGQPVMVGFVLMWLVPILFLTEYGRQQIGFSQSISLKWILIAILSGFALASLCHLLGLALYGKGEQNWFVSVAYTYQSDQRITLLDRHVAFALFTLPAIIASPIGEEVFFRGVVEHSNRHRWTPFAGACLAASLFALVHLTHHGIYRDFNGDIQIMPISGAIWVLLMFVTSLVFSFLRHKGVSIWTAVTAHAAFNLAMNTYIFYSLFVTKPQTVPAL